MLEYISFFGIRIPAYGFFNVSGFFVLLLFNLLQRGKPFIGCEDSCPENTAEAKVSKRFSVIFVLSCVQFFSGVLLNKLVGNFFNGGADNYFGFAIFAPWVFVAFCKLVKADAIGYLDAFTPAYALSLVTFKIACFCEGCCKGANVGPALYYPVPDQYEFPIQLVECLVAAVIFVFLLNYRKKAHRGTMHAKYLILYSATRFFTEFLRAEKDIFWLFKMYHIWCLAGVAVGTAEFFILKKRCAVSERK